MHVHSVAFDLTAASCVPAAFTSQSAIGEINLLTIVIPGQGRPSEPEYSCRCSENGINKKILPALPKLQASSNRRRRCLDSTRLISPFDYHTI
jgi:hypothetical protein